MLKMTRRIGRLSGLIAAGVAIVGTGSGVMAASYSAFSATTNSASNAWSTGSVALTNDGTSTAMFTGTGQANQQMNATGTKCIKVTSTGTLNTTVKLYSTGYTDSGLPSTPLGSHINLTINIGTAASTGSFSDCSSFVGTGTSVFTGKLSDFNAHTSYLNGILTSWTPTGTASEARVFQFIWSYDSGAPQSTTVNDAFTWEAQGS